MGFSDIQGSDPNVKDIKNGAETCSSMNKPSNKGSPDYNSGAHFNAPVAEYVITGVLFILLMAVIYFTPEKIMEDKCPCLICSNAATESSKDNNQDAKSNSNFNKQIQKSPIGTQAASKATIHSTPTVNKISPPGGGQKTKARK